MMMLTPFHFSKGASCVFVPRFHFCTFNCKINSPEIKLSEGDLSQTHKSKGCWQLLVSLCLRGLLKSHLLIRATSDCKAQLCCDMRTEALCFCCVAQTLCASCTVICPCWYQCCRWQKGGRDSWPVLEPSSSMSIPVTSTTSYAV